MAGGLRAGSAAATDHGRRLPGAERESFTAARVVEKLQHAAASPGMPSMPACPACSACPACCCVAEQPRGCKREGGALKAAAAGRSAPAPAQTLGAAGPRPAPAHLATPCPPPCPPPPPSCQLPPAPSWWLPRPPPAQDGGGGAQGLGGRLWWWGADKNPLACSLPVHLQQRCCHSGPRPSPVCTLHPP